jgi:hypothetical protein
LIEFPLEDGTIRILKPNGSTAGGRVHAKAISDLTYAKRISHMKVNELLALLSQMPANADVVVKGYDEGVDDVVDIALIQIRRDVHKEWYYGKHEIDETSHIQAVLLQGQSASQNDVIIDGDELSAIAAGVGETIQVQFTGRDDILAMRIIP